MIQIKKFFLRASFLITFLCLAQTKASACRWICFPAGDCYEFEGSCPASCECTCDDLPIANFNRETDYILAMDGQTAYIVQGDKKNKIASDNMAAFNTNITAKYAKLNRNDPKIKAEMAAEWKAFLKKPDTSKVSAKRLDVFAKETGLKIRTK